MALNLGLEKGVKLSKKDKARLMKKIKQGWKATCLVPDYGFDESNNLILKSENIRRIIKNVKIEEDGIFIEKAIENDKNLKVTWNSISKISNSKEMRDGLKIELHNELSISFSIYNSYKVKQITQYIANYIFEKANN